MGIKCLKAILAIVLLAATVALTCRSNTLLTYRQIRESLVGGKVKTFVEEMSHRNGVYLLENDKNTLYLMLGRLGKEKANNSYVTNLVIKPSGDSLTISYNETEKAGLYSKKLNKNLIYRIKHNRHFKEIRIFRNGKETHFENLSL